MKLTDKLKKKQSVDEVKTQSKSPSEMKSKSVSLVKTLRSSSGNLKNVSLSMLSRSVGMKLFLLIFCGILICVLSVGLFSYSRSKVIIQDKVTNSSKQTITQAADKLDLLFQSYENMTMQFIVDSEMNQLYANLLSSGDDYAKFESFKKIDAKLQQILLSNKTLYGGALIPLKEGIQGTTAGSSQIDIAGSVNTEWMKQAIAENGRIIWITAQPKGFNGKGAFPTIGLARMIKDTNTNEPMFVLLLEIKLDLLKEQLGSISLADNSNIRVVDGNDAVVYSSNLEELTKPSGVVLPKEGKQAELGALNFKQSGKDQLGVYSKFKTMNWKLLGTVPVDSLVKDAKQIRNLTWIMAGIAALIAIGIGYLVIRLIAMPLALLRNLMNEGEKGNLTVRSSIKSKDEIGQLAQSFNQMMTQITALVDKTNRSASEVLGTAGELTEASKKTAVAAKEIAVATEEIANGATSLAVESERGSELTDNMGQRMQDVIEANTQMGGSASEVEKASQQGTEYMSVLIEKTGLTEEMTRSMVEKVDKLKDSTRSIRKILDVLNNLTKQTNILSLNATIEAARAGVAGKGFMVVADEIRKLADQSRQSIDVVAQITDTIQREIDDTVSVLSEAYPIFQEQIDSVKEANQIFLTVRSQMGVLVNHLESVTGSISQLDQTQSVLSEAMSNVSAVAEESSATSQEVASLSNEQLGISDSLVNLSDKLESVSTELKESLTRFRTI
jgi:methyl-accepting chemotaxis protein